MIPNPGTKIPHTAQHSPEISQKKKKKIIHIDEDPQVCKKSLFKNSGIVWKNFATAFENMFTCGSQVTFIFLQEVVRTTTKLSKLFDKVVKIVKKCID